LFIYDKLKSKKVNSIKVDGMTVKPDKKEIEKALSTKTNESD
jgi:hypothetical protein